MNKRNVLVYYGEGKGKTILTMGYAIHMASQGKSVIIIQFRKRKNEKEIGFIRRLEPEIKLFLFEKSMEKFDELSEEEQKEKSLNIRNGFHFARKVLVTGECDVLILDGFLWLIQKHMISREELEMLFSGKSEGAEIMITGGEMNEMVQEYADEIYQVCELW